MKISDAFPSSYLKAEDLQGRPVRLTISDTKMESLGDESKPVVYFVGKQKGLVLNKVNSSLLAVLYGDETDAWRGHPIEVFPDKTHFNGRMVDCLRVRAPAQPAQPVTPAPAPGPVAAAPVAASEPVAPAPTPAPAAAPAQPQPGEPFVDDIPW